MTICISAMCNEGNEEKIVFATDHMISTHLGQFEKEIKKYKILNKNIIAMLSGQTLLFDRILKGTDEFHDFFRIKAKIEDNLAIIRKEIIKKEIYDLFGIDESYVKNLLPAPIQNPFVQKILGTTAEFTLETNILLIGFDNNGKAQISEIDERGHADYRDIHFHAIGSGSTQALNTLLFQNHSKNCKLKTSIYNVYKAKRNAEVASGVGKETEVLVLTKNGIKKLTEENLKTLNGVYSSELKFGIDHQDLNSLDSSIEDMRKEEVNSNVY